MQKGSSLVAMLVQPLLVWYVTVHQHVFCIGQCWKHVKQDAGRGHEERGQGFLDILPGFWTLSPGGQTHTARGIKIQQCKTQLFQSEVEHLGHKISKGGVSMIPEYVQKIKD